MLAILALAEASIVCASEGAFQLRLDRYCALGLATTVWALLVCLPPLCPTRFLGCDNPFTGRWGNRVSFAGTDGHNLVPLDPCPPSPLGGGDAGTTCG